ncbi:hypothetical protein ALI22I_44595 [Saccharothrix sp. ALI-22-I]|uniref:HEXXH motif domain-containing protein n=1 Tax=Saccharothrix sp. ALI-22-I TaxID=1933778 RepID=UPI00097BAF6D|nr:HEXXH motif domain-containing protein [Saccharothrix sp. ALI-22-I]ONI80408.1 hypothetical protein ALI22I_44595 [Saccharothrix sp. ALI-22-I]
MTGSPDLLPHHHITPVQLDVLASGGHEDGAFAVLRDVERSRWRLALGILVRHMRNHLVPTGPLVPVAEAWRLLVEAQRVRPEEVTALLGRPQVGVWSAHLLRRLRGKADDAAPLWFHVGQLHALAAASGIVAGLRFRMPIPLWDGLGVLPGLGSVELPDHTGWTHATVVSEGAAFTIDGESADTAFRPVRNFVVPAGERPPVLTLDDTSCYRGSEIPEPPEPLSESEEENWRAALAGAWAVLDRDHPDRARELAAGLVAITPRVGTPRFRPHSASVGDGFGAAIISAPHDPVQLAVTMVHEFQHSKLTAIGHLVPLTEDDPVLDCYAPWRDDPRGTSGLFQGVYAFTAVAEFWAVQWQRLSGAERDLARFEFALVRRQVVTALDVLKGRSALTPTGRRFATRIGERLAALDSVDVPEAVRSVAESAADDHWIGWRVSNLRADPARVRTEAARWLSGRPPGPIAPPAAVVPNEKPRRLDVKAVLNRALLCGRDDFEAAHALLGREDHVVADAGEGDFALVGGDVREALARYAEELSEVTDRPGAWSGYALALRAVRPGRAATTLLHRPELVRAVHDEVATATGEAPDVENLAGWLGARWSDDRP